MIAYVTAHLSNDTSTLTTVQTKMQTFLGVRSTVLDDMVALDGPGGVPLDFCNSCGNVQGIPLYRCRECSYSLLYCSECIVKSHIALPLHRLEVCSCFYLMNVFTLIATSAGRMDFSIEPLLIHSDIFVTSDTAVMRAPRTPLLVSSLSSMATAGISYMLDFANVAQAIYPMSTIANSFACTGTPHPSIAPKLPSPSMSLKHTTK